MLAVGEFFCWTVIGLVLGFAGHWWKSNADAYPDILDKDRPLLNMALTEYDAVNYIEGHRYDEAGYWEYYSLKNLFFYLSTGVVGTLVLVYATAEGHAIARSSLCSAVAFIKLTPLFCP